MRFATAKISGEKAFVFGLPTQKTTEFFLWKDYAALFPTDKTLQQTMSLLDFIKRSSVLLPQLKKNLEATNKLKVHTLKSSDFALPFQPPLFRDFYCFEEHVRTMRKGRGAEMIPEWYEAPIFYYSNPFSFQGPNEEVPFPKGVTELDCELEVACVIGKDVRDIDLAQAREAIFGYSLLNDWTARDIGRWEMKLNMGQTKAKDFSTTFGDYIITPDEIESRRSAKGFDIEFELLINGEVMTRKNWNGIQFSFEEMLVRAAKNCTVHAGEVHGSGTMGGGALAEHNLGKETKRWLKIGDEVKLRWLPDGPTLANRIGASR